MKKPHAAVDVSAQLRKAIADCGKSLNQLGQEAGLDSGRLSRFMRGERDLLLEAAGRLFAVLGLRLVRAPDGPESGRSRNAKVEVNGERLRTPKNPPVKKK